MSNQRETLDKAVAQIIAMTDECKTMEELQIMLDSMAYAIGGMVCHFPKDERSSVLIGMTQALGTGLQLTAKHIGEPSDIEMIVGSGRK